MKNLKCVKITFKKIKPKGDGQFICYFVQTTRKPISRESLTHQVTISFFYEQKMRFLMTYYVSHKQLSLSLIFTWFKVSSSLPVKNQMSKCIIIMRCRPRAQSGSRQFCSDTQISLFFFSHSLFLFLSLSLNEMTSFSQTLNNTQNISSRVASFIFMTTRASSFFVLFHIYIPSWISYCRISFGMDFEIIHTVLTSSK